MGPSVNLSARLMGKAPMHTILCDETIKSNDRVHNFTHFADIKAKGYDLPVRTFKPLIDREDMFSSTNMGHINGMITSPSKHSKTFSVSSGMLNHEQKILRGRENELMLVASHLQSFARYYSLLQEIIVGGPINLNVLAAHVHQPMFDLDIPCKVINITGHEGIGRRYFLSTIFDRMALDNSCHNYANWNIILHSVHVSRVRLNESFACFRKLLVSILSEFTEWALKSSHESSNPNDSNELHFSLSEIRSNRAKSLKGLDLLLKRLPKDVAMRRPLLSMLGKHYEIPENEVTRGLHGNDRMFALEEFLFTLIQGYQQITQRLLCLNM